MSSEFKEVAKISESQRRRAGVLLYMYNEFVTSSRKDIRTLVIDSFTGLERSEDIAQNVLTDSPKRQTDFSIKLVDKCLELMRLTLSLIEAQQALAKRNPTNLNTIIGCIESDMDAFQDSGAKVREYIEHRLPSIPERELSKWDSSLDQLFRDYDPIFTGVSSSFDVAPTETLIQKVHDLRFDVAMVFTELNDLQLSLLSEHITNYVTLKKAIDEGIMEEGPVRQEIGRSLVSANKLLPKCIAGLILKEHFYATIYDAGDDNLGTKAFKAQHYVSVSVHPMVKQIA